MFLVELENRSQQPAEAVPAAAKPRPEGAWYQALVMTGRAAPGSGGGIAPAGITRKQRWREVPGLAEEPSFRSRLAAEGITEEQFDRALTEAPEALRDRLPQTPSWLTEVVEA